mmetsp:Transcript_23123/g.64245  ORF Transcript_23123/g.64245 Transcript_23123/m.64245 type:complete len:261 (+) Transcript_23123:1770-2552(+)
MPLCSQTAQCLTPRRVAGSLPASRRVTTETTWMSAPAASSKTRRCPLLSLGTQFPLRGRLPLQLKMGWTSALQQLLLVWAARPCSIWWWMKKPRTQSRWTWPASRRRCFTPAVRSRHAVPQEVEGQTACGTMLPTAGGAVPGAATASNSTATRTCGQAGEAAGRRRALALYLGLGKQARRVAAQTLTAARTATMTSSGSTLSALRRASARRLKLSTSSMALARPGGRCTPASACRSATNGAWSIGPEPLPLLPGRCRGRS